MAKFWLKLRRKSLRRWEKKWTERFGDRSLTVPLAMLIGLLAAVAAAALHAGVTALEKFFHWVGVHQDSYSLQLLLITPLLGLFLSYIFQRWFCGSRYAKSLSPLILSLSRRKTSVPLRETWTHVVSSALSVGCGGSAGLEAPSVLTGAAIGSNTAAFFGLDQRQKMLMIGCGCAAAISAIFGSPIGGVLFAVEVLLPEFSVAALVPMVIASAVAMVTSKLAFPHEQALLAINAPWRGDAVPFYFLLGVVCAGIGLAIIRSNYFFSGKLKGLYPPGWRRLLTGGVALCSLLALFPVLRGQGYIFISALFHGDTGTLVSASPLLHLLPESWVLAAVVGGAVLLKALSTVLTVDSGGDGGIFAPSMFVGAFVGFAFAKLINLCGFIELQEPNFVVVGMCGVFTAVLRAPLTGVFLIAEVTGSYILLVPLMIVSSVSWVIARHFEPNSIYLKALVEGNLLSTDRDETMLRTLSVRVCVRDEFVPLYVDWKLSEAKEAIEESIAGEIFPVFDRERRLAGIVRLEHLRPILFNAELAKSLLVFDVMEPSRTVLSEDDNLAAAMRLLERCRVDTLPVTGRNGAFLGFVSRSDIFRLYRVLVRDSAKY